MSVIAFPNLAPQGPSASMSWELRSLTAINRSPLNAVATTLERPGAHWAVRMPYQNLAEDRRARLQSFVSSARGHAQRFYVPVYGWTRRGSFPATELLTNNTFANGTSGWTPGSEIAITAVDGVLRVQRSAVTSASGVTSASAAVTAFAPYALRGISLQGRGYSGGVRITESSLGGAATFAPGRLHTQVIVSSSTTYALSIRDENTSGLIAGDYFSVPYTSLSRCAMVDNAPNLLLRSREIGDASWTKTRASVVSDSGTVAPDGTGTSDYLVEDTSNDTHVVLQSASRTSAAEYLCAYGFFRRGIGTRDIELDVDDGASNGGSAMFNLGTGAITSSADVGTSTNTRAVIRDYGAGWYYCAVIALCPATTTARTIARLVNAGSSSYTGDGASAVLIWDYGLARSGVPVRAGTTVATALPSGTSQTGGALYLKGLPASTSGLLLQGDPAEIIIGSTSQLVRTRAPLNSDAAGLGYFEFEPPLRVSPSDGAAVIVQNPMCRMMMENNVNGWTDRLGGFSDLEFAAMEDTYP